MLLGKAHVCQNCPNKGNSARIPFPWCTHLFFWDIHHYWGAHSALHDLSSPTSHGSYRKKDEKRSENSLGFGITHKVHPMELQYLTPRWSVLAGLPPSTSSPSGMLFWWLLPGFWPPGCPWGRSRRPGGPWGPPPSPSQRAAVRSRELGFSVSSFPTQPSTPTQETRNQSLG